VPSEAELADAWEARRYAATELVDSHGRRLRVVFPGRRWGGPGPDFRGAVLGLADGRLLRGDIEVHRHASGWAAHHHATDPAYAEVVLHVVGAADADSQDAVGQSIATVVLRPTDSPPGALGPLGDRNRLGPPHERDAPGWPVFMDQRGVAAWPARTNQRDVAAWPAWPGRLDPRSELELACGAPCVRTAPAVLRVVEAAGRARFAARAGRFEADLTAAEPDQVVWRGVAEALGFSRDTAAFGRLADAVPWPEAARAVAERGPLGLAGLLLGTAGLLGQASLAEAHAFRWFERRFGARQVLGAAAWDRRTQRGSSQPTERCRGLAALAGRWLGQDQPDGPAELVLEAVSRAAAGRGRRTRPLWRLVQASPWIGRGRAQVMVVNVLVPFAAAAGVEGAAGLFERLAGEPSNRVLRYMAGLLGGDGSGVRFRGACRQQGLLHLFKSTCASRRCGQCPARERTWPWVEDV
jgi:hypothetical protein